MPLVIACYLLANTSYFFVLPSATLNKTNTVAVVFGSKVFGPVGALLIALIVSLSCFGALNATTFTSGRLVYAAGKEGYLPEMFGNIGIGKTREDIGGSASSLRTKSKLSKSLARILGDSDTGLFYTPILAMLLNLSLTTIYILIGEFSTLVTFYGVAGYTFYFLTVLGLIVLRVREPDLERPYKCWITTPIIFCCVSLFLLSRAVFAQPLQTLIVVGFIMAGVPVWVWRVRVRGGGAGGKRRRGSSDAGWRFWRRWRT
jgi:amino acid transporter